MQSRAARVFVWIHLVCLFLPVGMAFAAGAGLTAAVSGDGAMAIRHAETAAGHRWSSVPGLGPVEGLLDVASSEDGRVAVADLRGVLIGSPEATGAAPLRFRRITRPGIVHRVGFDEAGSLWVAGQEGLFRIDDSGRAFDATPGVGQAGRATIALDLQGEFIAAGTAESAFVGLARGDGRHDSTPIDWVRIREGLTPGGVSDVALGWPTRSGPRPLWIVAAGQLHLAWVRLVDGRPWVSPARTMRIVGGPLGDALRRVVVTRGSGEVAVLFGRAVARAIGADLEPGGEDRTRWEVGYPVLPPEARITDIEQSAGVVWLASTSGLLRGDRLTGPFRRATSPAGSRAVLAVAGAGEFVLTTTASQLLRGTPQSPVPTRTAQLDRMPRDPALQQVQVRALSMLRLETFRTDRLWRGVGRRGWWPSLSMQAGIDYGSGKTRDYDESFSYGQLNRLNDRGTARSTDYDAAIALSWDLGEIAYSSEAVDLSRESRQVISLRDNVLDEINQLYFDRQRALRALSTFADWSDPEAATLRLRALELAAGLDGWTGGWFSAQVEIPLAARRAWSRPLAPPGPALARPPALPATHESSHPEASVPTNQHENEKRENS